MADLELVDLEGEFLRLELRDGDTVIWRTPLGFEGSTAETAHRIRDLLNRNHKDITILVLPQDHVLERADEEAMAAIGWVRPPRRRAPRRQTKEPHAASPESTSQEEEAAGPARQRKTSG